MQTRPRGPKAILGDLNGDPDSFPSLLAALHDGHFVDIGSRPDLGGPPGQPICYPPRHIRPTRRDYVFLSIDIMPFVSCFSVHAPDTVPVHSALVLKIA